MSLRHVATLARGVVRTRPFALARATRPFSTGPPAAPVDAPAAPSSPPSLLAAYGELCKARLSSLVVVTSGAGFLLAGHPVDWVACSAAVVGTALAAASANTFNQVAEARTDALMRRTAGRPLPTGRLTRGAAIAFGVGAGVTSTAVLLAGTNPLTAALGVGNIILYAAVYTPLKQVTTLNTAVGALVGAVPPLMGWAAATGSLAAVEPFLLGYALFAWQFPHFYALAWPLRRDYARGGYAMVPCVDPTGARTSRLALRHAGALALIPFGASFLGVTSPMFALEGIVLNAYFLNLARRFHADPTDAAARALFRASLWYLPVLAALMVFHASHWVSKEEDVLQLEGQAAAAAVGSGAAASPALARGTSVGEAIENAIANARILGRGLCVHEVYLAQLLGEERRRGVVVEGGAASAAAAPSVSSSGGGSAFCPVVAVEHLSASAKQLGGGAKVTPAVAGGAAATKVATV